MGLPVDRIRVVYDCMVFLQGAARSSSPSGLCLLLAEQGFVELCVSEEILAEIGEVLRRPKVRAKFPTLTDELVSQFLKTVGGFSTFFGNVTREFPFVRDPTSEIPRTSRISISREWRGRNTWSVVTPICSIFQLLPTEIDAFVKSVPTCRLSIRLRFWDCSERL